METEHQVLVTDCKLQAKRANYTKSHHMHYKNHKILRIIYYTLGFSSTISSAIITFLSGLLLTADHEDMMVAVTLELVLSFFILITNGVLNFGKLEEKMAKHNDMKNQYHSLLIDIDEKLHSQPNKEEIDQFYNILCEKQKILIGYETNTFCFN